MSISITHNSGIETIKKMYCTNCTDDEIKVFIHACNRTGLDPFMRQIYAIKRGSKLTIQTGIDGFRLIAERTGNYSPGRESTILYDDKGKILAATAYIKKRTSDNVWHEIAATAYMDEYNPGQGLWNKMPRTMLAKCAEAVALRKAFPAELSGIYTKEEMEQDASTKEEMEQDASTTSESPQVIEEPKEPLITEEEEMYLESYVIQIKNQVRIKAIKDALSIESFDQMKSKDLARSIRYLQKCIKEQEEIENESATVA